MRLKVRRNERGKSAENNKCKDWRRITNKFEFKYVKPKCHSQKRSPSLTWSVFPYATSSVQLQNSTFSFAYCFLDRFILWTNFKMNIRVMLSFVHQADIFFFDHITLFLQFVFFCWSNFNLVGSFAITRTTTNLYGSQNIVYYQQHNIFYV